jgi:hypothetical protein
MTIEDIRHYRNAQPFEPFVIVMVDGRIISVPERLRIGIAPWGKIGVFEGSAFHLLKPTDITEIRFNAQSR